MRPRSVNGRLLNGIFPRASTFSFKDLSVGLLLRLKVPSVIAGSWTFSGLDLRAWVQRVEMKAACPFNSTGRLTFHLLRKSLRAWRGGAPRWRTAEAGTV